MIFELELNKVGEYIFEIPTRAQYSRKEFIFGPNPIQISNTDVCSGANRKSTALCSGGKSHRLLQSKRRLSCKDFCFPVFGS